MVVSQRRGLLKRLLGVVSALPTRRFEKHPMYLLDKWGHGVRLPKRWMHPICDEFDRWVGLYDEWDLEAEAPEPAGEEDCSLVPVSGTLGVARFV